MIDADSAPLERVLGDTSELRVAEKLIAMPDFEFSVTELAKNTGLSRPSIYSVLRTFHRWGIVHRLERGKRTRYRINTDSRLVQSLYDFNHELVFRIVGGTDPEGEIETEAVDWEPRIEVAYVRQASAFTSGVQIAVPEGIAPPRHPPLRAVA
jgi:DNA-binding transcriptional ArsR family regulator